MKLTSPSNVRAILQELDISPDRFHGQNFLIDLNILELIVSAAELNSEDHVLEIGPGLGVLTEQLAAKATSVTAVEIDRRLYEYVGRRLAGLKNLNLICADVLDVELAPILKGGNCKVVANLPYSIAGRVLVDLAMERNPPSAIIATVQFEVATRLAAVAGDRNNGALSIWMQSVYEVSVRKTISPTCFWPRPKVKSAVVVMKRRGVNPCAPEDRQFFHVLVKQAFMHRRKQLASILAKSCGDFSIPSAQGVKILKSLGLDPCARPEDLGTDDWCRLAKSLSETLSRKAN